LRYKPYYNGYFINLLVDTFTQGDVNENYPNSEINHFDNRLYHNKIGDCYIIGKEDSPADVNSKGNKETTPATLAIMKVRKYA